MKYFRKPLYLLLVISIMTGMLSLQPPEPVRAANSENAVRISQVYGGGGNKDSLYKNDFIELFNASDVDVDLTGWSVQYAAVTGSSWQKTNLIGTIPANSYYLIQEAQGSGGTLELPDPDAGGGIAMSGTNFKVALTTATTALSGICPTEGIIVDFVGVGPDANCYEGEAPTAILTNTTSAIRKENGCQDTDENGEDFVTGSPTPRNTASPTHSCSVAPSVFPERFIISEYIEGSGQNKAIELYNGTGADIDLSQYKLALYSNGNAAPQNPVTTWPAETTLANGSTYVIVHNQANAAFQAKADLINGTVTGYNGDDTLVLYQITPEGDLVQDSFGKYLFRPSPQFGSGDTAAQNRTLVRKESVCQGDTDITDDFDPVDEYLGYAIDTLTYLGSHTMTCGAPIDVPPSVSTTVPANNATNVGLASDIKITFSEPVSLSDDWYSISCTLSGEHTAVVTDTNPIFTLDPDVDFSGNETCTVTIDADKVLDQDETPDAMAADYSFSFATAEGCGGPTTKIYDIQGEGMSAALLGTHTVEGVVVGDYQVGGRNGFFIQEEVGDGNPATSDGIFIYAPGLADADVNLGDKVRVTGSVSEFYEQTQITNNSWQLCSSGNTIEPTVITLPVDDVDDFEKYEGMLVKFEQPLIVSEYFNFDRYGEIVLTTERFVTGTAKYEPGSDEYYAEIERFNLSKITLDDGRSQQNQHPAYHPNGAEFTLDNLFRGGGTVTNLVGVMDYYQNIYRLQPVFIGEYEETNPRTAAPELQEGDLTIASFNVLNYFVTLDGSGNRCGPNGGMECRGADNAAEFTRQRAKILAAMNIIDADIFGLMEIENDGPTGNNPVADLVAGLNELKGAGTYAYIQTGSIGTDAIKQAILYKPASVTPVGNYVTLTEALDTRFDTSKNRPSLAQAFKDNASDVEFVVSVNHLKSKGSACAGDPDLGDGAGNCNIARTEAAQALADWLVPAKWNGIDKFLIIGDLNAYEKETPIDAIKAGADDTEGTDDDFVNTLLAHQGEDFDPYGYVFDGMVGYLDHALASPAMNAIVLDAKFWHINADEADIIDYDMSFKPAAQAALLYAPDAYRSSDHDPVIVSLKTIPDNQAPVADDQSVTTAEDTAIEITLVANDVDGDTLTYIIVDEPDHGDLSLVSGNKVTYTPDANYFGADSFTFKANDGDLDSNIATVSITVTEVNHAPVAEDQSVSMDKNTSLEITLVASDIDGDPLTYSIRQSASHGSLSVVNGNKVTYTPNANFSGMDSFTFRANDGSLNSNTATVVIMVNSTNVAPIAQAQTVETDEDTAKEITLLASDVDGDPLTYAIVAQPQHGSLSLLSGNKLTYTPDENYNGPDSFTFKANDGTLDSNIAEVTINVKPVNDAPVAYDQTVIAVAGETIEIELEALDIDGDILEFIIVEEPLHGTFELEGNILKYTPSATFGGVDSFTFKANDGNLDSNIATVTITVSRTQYLIFLPFTTR